MKLLDGWWDAPNLPHCEQTSSAYHQILFRGVSQPIEQEIVKKRMASALGHLVLQGPSKCVLAKVVCLAPADPERRDGLEERR